MNRTHERILWGAALVILAICWVYKCRWFPDWRPAS